jgi:hypothetical protein
MMCGAPWNAASRFFLGQLGGTANTALTSMLSATVMGGWPFITSAANCLMTALALLVFAGV